MQRELAGWFSCHFLNALSLEFNWLVFLVWHIGRDVLERVRVLNCHPLVLLIYLEPRFILHIGFVTGMYDADLLRQKAYRDKMSFAIAMGILNYLKVSN